MKIRMPLALISALLLATPAFAGARATRSAEFRASEAGILRSAEAPDLGELRAGVSAPAATLARAERESLAAASARDAGLGSLRAGDLTLSDHDVQLIVIVAAVVIILIII